MPDLRVSLSAFCCPLAAAAAREDDGFWVTAAAGVNFEIGATDFGDGGADATADDTPVVKTGCSGVGRSAGAAVANGEEGVVFGDSTLP